MQQQITSARSFLDRMLTEGGALARKGEDAAATRLGVGDDPAARSDFRKKALMGGAAAGVMGLLLGSGKVRKLAGNAALVGGLGVLGKIAYDAYKGGSGGNQQPETPADRPVHLLTDADAERRALTLTHAIIAAAKADGHIDDAEARAIEEQMAELPEPVRARVASALLRLADAEAVAAMATSDQERREIYAASVLACGKDHPAEVAYLAALARALNLPATQVVAIEAGVLAG